VYDHGSKVEGSHISTVFTSLGLLQKASLAMSMEVGALPAPEPVICTNVVQYRIASVSRIVDDWPSLILSSPFPSPQTRYRPQPAGLSAVGTPLRIVTRPSVRSTELNANGLTM